MPLDDLFFGDRSGKHEDPFSHYWSIGTHVRDVSSGRAAKGNGANGFVLTEGWRRAEITFQDRARCRGGRCAFLLWPLPELA